MLGKFITHSAVEAVYLSLLCHIGCVTLVRLPGLSNIIVVHLVIFF